MTLRRFFILGFLSISLAAQTNPYQDWQSWKNHYPDYVLQSAHYWVTNRTSQVILGSWLITLPVLLKTDSRTSQAIKDAQLLGPNTRQFGEAWGRYYGALFLAGLTALETLNPSHSKIEKYQRLEYVLTAYGVSGALTQTLKFVTQRKRPNGADRLSFPSGHTTLAFATAEITRQLYGNWWGSAAYGIALVTGIERVQDNRHWLGDVVTGAVLSATIARATAPGKVKASTLDIAVSEKPQFSTPLLTFVWHLPN